MNIIQSIILGLVEGFTEFLPISSTFHLIWTSNLLLLPQNGFVKLFEVFIQSGAILAVLFLYFNELKNNLNLVRKILVSFIPTALVGFVFYDIIKNVLFERLIFTTSIFVIVGLIFIIIERLIAKGKIKLSENIPSLTYKHAVYIGLFQSFAVVPGVSRAGAVIICMMLLRFSREDSAKYSFMLSIPSIMAASFFDVIQMRHVLYQNTDHIIILLIGFVVAFVSAIIGVKWLIRYLQRHSLELFGWYRVVVGIILLLFLIQ